MPPSCPQCNAHVAGWKFGLSAVGFSRSCPKCTLRLSVSSVWQYATLAIALLSLGIAVVLSVQHRTWLPYLLTFGAVTASTWAAGNWATPRASGRGSLGTWAAFVVLASLILWLTR